LPNEALLVHHLELRRSQSTERCQFSLVIVGMDRFRAVNETLGEAEADKIMAAIARRLKASAGDGVVARLQGDRFAVLLEDAVEFRHALAGLERIRTALSAPFDSVRGPMMLTASMGLVISPAAATPTREVLRAAESAMAEAKAAGPGSHQVFDEAVRKHAQQRMNLENALRQAIATGGIVVHYQPVVDLSTGRLAGFEALARWKRTGMGLLAPDKYVPVAEETQLICEVDIAVLRDAWANFAAWRKRFPQAEKLTLSSNLSARHFENTALVGRIEAILDETGVPPGCVKLEVTESALAENPDDTAAIMRSLESRGLQFGLDDFGTGYSSLSYLHQFPFRTLKIDRSFISSLGTDRQRQQLVRAIVAMARTLGLRTVAEGIETGEQYRFLADLKCEFGQGYYIARPLTADGAAALVAKNPSW
jgi:diguanylate cyclase (GGDEF)-like protein